MKTKAFARSVAVVIALGTMGAILYVAYLFNDISNFYSDTVEELVVFKEAANTAWQQMRRHPEYAFRFSRTDVTIRKRRQADDDCSCGPQSINCPAGPPGPPGPAGTPGEDGDPGNDGSEGTWYDIFASNTPPSTLMNPGSKMAKTFLAASLATSIALGTMISLLFIAYLVNDITSFYQETFTELTNFKELANTAWYRMKPNPYDLHRLKREQPRSRRQFVGDCGCAEQSKIEEMKEEESGEIELATDVYIPSSPEPSPLGRPLSTKMKARTEQTPPREYRDATRKTSKSSHRRDAA
ncbi:unnamed protein product [Nippostrongylus brasiliensis]|uniref:Col_cuticle_N domain-containing protein n=1 Tax=Nippostrongylus brasiliensis TaxID=27835 RepID=A0A158QX35_NIPBR|nr:unnamed protein product [Nippostrongylus brasiliensis]